MNGVCREARNCLFFCLFFISLFPVMGYAEEILYDSGQEKSVSQKTPDTSRGSDTKKGQSEDPVLPATSNADKIRVSLGAGYYAMIGSSGVGHSLSLLVGVDFRLASIYRMGLEGRFYISPSENKDDRFYVFTAFWTHELVYIDTGFFEFNQHINVGYQGLIASHMSTNAISFLFGFGADWRLTQWISLNLSLDYSFALFVGDGVGAGMNGLQALLKVVFHF